MNYKLLTASAAWKIYDVVIEDISLVSNYRSQFARVIVQSWYEDSSANSKRNKLRYR